VIDFKANSAVFRDVTKEWAPFGEDRLPTPSPAPEADSNTRARRETHGST